MIVRVPVLRVLTATTLLIAMAGCKSWQPVTVGPRQIISDERPTSLRVTDVDGDRLTILRPMIRNDSIVTSDTDPFGVPVRALGVPTDDVNSLEVARFNPVKSAVIAAAAVTVAATWARVALRGGAGSNPNTGPIGKDAMLSFSSSVQALIGIFR
ncbi:MAG: hypothetical protein O2958_11475 [Gemmatimonadetes bacterium]|nr:hypothetical protein [Gemmatimonadota bacterium]MDA1104891.1 hypothetical protein [Gemmatimonadota bacterium]